MPLTFRRYSLARDSLVEVTFSGDVAQDLMAKDHVDRGLSVGKNYGLREVLVTSQGSWFVRLKSYSGLFWGVYFEGVPGGGLTLDEETLKNKIWGMTFSEWQCACR